MIQYVSDYIVIHRLVGQVVKASTPKAEGPEFDSSLRRDFSG